MTLAEALLIFISTVKSLDASQTGVVKPQTAAYSVSIPKKSTDDLLALYAQAYEVSKETLEKIGICESGLRSKATNGIYGGMFQFSPTTWTITRKAMGLDSDPDLRFNAEEAIHTTAWKIAHNGIAAWPNCGK